MKKNIKVFLVFTVCVLMLFYGMALSSVSVSAAVKTQGTIDLKKKTLTIPKGKKTVIRQNKITIVKGRKYRIKAKYEKVKLKSTKPSIVTIYKKTITAKNPGSAELKVTYKGITQSLKIKVTASHKHSFKVTKKATCKAKGIRTCTDCGLKNTLSKTKHHYITNKCTSIEGRGKKWIAYTIICPGCHWDMTDWTNEQQNAHQYHIEAQLAGMLPIAGCAGYTGVAGAVRYEKYVKVEVTETDCENCGAWDMDRTYNKDLYYVDAKTHKRISANEDPWEVWSYETYCKEYGFLLCEGCHLEVMPGYECHRCHIVAPNTPVAKNEH